MNRTTRRIEGWTARWALLAIAGLLSAGVAWAQVPVDEDGNPLEAEAIGEAGDAQAVPADPVLSDEELQALVGPIALYPDELLAVVLPASAYPLQIVQAARFLKDLEEDDSLEPDPEWDESVVALLNYPEVIEMMNEDLDWTYALGEAVVRQQADVVAAIEAFRDRAYAAGNLKSDDHQTVTRDEGVIQIEPVEEEIIYVPYYEPERVVVYQPTPVYHYYPRPYPVYYYPYPYDYSFASGYFWGVTTAFRIGWFTDHLLVFHHSYWGHPYYGRHYYGHWYRRPSILVYNRYYVNDRAHRPPHHERDGDFWRPRRHSGALIDRYHRREAYYTDRRRERSEEGYRDARDARRVNAGRDRARPGFRGDGIAARRAEAEPGFARPRSNDTPRHDRNRTVAERRQAGDDTIRFRPRERTEVARRDAGEDRAIRFRPRPDRAERPAARPGRDAPGRVTRSDRAVERSVRPSTREHAARPSIREHAARPSTRDHSARPSIREPAARPHMNASPPRRAAPAPRAVQRAPAPRPRISTPR
ncbi:MAG TPA: DUF3300 domain-containing protein, partial [Woeseiaceae bacterium]|nr:DUF3300 domain-containing protein [Woeseiaceae bacterium]